MNATLLVEILTEELPPKALARLGEAFRDGLIDGLARCRLVSGTPESAWFATPRRLAVLVRDVADAAADRIVEEKIMPVSVAFDAEGKPTAALEKKLGARGILLSGIARFERRPDGKSEALFYKAAVAGARLDEVLGGLAADALKKLPVPKIMRWGTAENSDRQFARPVHGVMLLHGSRPVPGELFGLASRPLTRGHRFLSKAGREGDIPITAASDYDEILKRDGKVIAGFGERRALIASLLEAKAAELGAVLDIPAALLDEVTALVEWPAVYAGEFEPEFLDVPHECLILTMRQNQKYFPLFDASRRLINRFLIVSNMEIDHPESIVDGNARVVRPRLSDARFFFEQDCRTTLASRLDRLENVVYHNRLGSLRDRAERLEALAGKIAGRLGADASRTALIQRAARLSKADLVTGMVGEFPELQGIMGRYYALRDGENAETAEAIRAHYQPRFSGDALPAGPVACAAALADKLDALTGFFGIGQLPTGEKDPFGLRRAALGVLRILMETPLPLDLAGLIADARAGFHGGVLTEAVDVPLFDFMLDRLRGLLREAGHAPDAVDAVLFQRPARIDLVPAKLDAVREFMRMPEAPALAAANKRIGNILRKAEGNFSSPPLLELLTDDAEKALFARVNALSPVIAARVEKKEYAAALKALAEARADVDRFFDAVMVNVDDSATRANRLALLRALFDQFNAVADISRLCV
ncbi:MAG: glycine--tRNA ligase subunit beta [Candidatus Accumulibacter sp.]|jgi:glycyl-tRNA synthetase beta chain|nr:glycine--tRNA ligase subunit beta [Accumulibacter sp.]